MSAYHDRLMSEYYAAREAYETRMEAYSLGYDTEMVEYRRTESPVTFKTWLQERQTR